MRLHDLGVAQHRPERRLAPTGVHLDGPVAQDRRRVAQFGEDVVRDAVRVQGLVGEVDVEDVRALIRGSAACRSPARCSCRAADAASWSTPSWEALQRLLDPDAALHAGERRAEAEVDAEAERDVVVEAAVDVEAVGVGERRARHARPPR